MTILQTWMVRMGGALRSTSGRGRRGSELRLCWREVSEVKTHAHTLCYTTLVLFHIGFWLNQIQSYLYVDVVSPDLRLVAPSLPSPRSVSFVVPLLIHHSLSSCPVWAVLVLWDQCRMWPGSCKGASGLAAVWVGPGSGWSGLSQLGLAQPYTTFSEKGRKTHLAGQLTHRSPLRVCVCEPRNAIIEVEGRAGHWGARLLCDTSTPAVLPLSSLSLSLFGLHSQIL